MLVGGRSSFNLRYLYANRWKYSRAGPRTPHLIQSLFPAIHGCAPSEYEILQYALQLQTLKQKGAKISLVQIYSANRPMARSGCSHLPLKSLSKIAQTVREIAGLRAEVF